MSKKSILPQARRHIWVFDEDWAFLEKTFGAGSPSRLGVGPTIRSIIHIYVGNLKAQAIARLDSEAKAKPPASPAPKTTKEPVE